MRAAAQQWVYCINETGEGGHYAPNWERDVLGSDFKCPECNGLARRWPHRVDVHLVSMKRSAIFRPWGMRITCIQEKLAEQIRPHLGELVWGDLYLSKDMDMDPAIPFSASQFKSVLGYKCCYATNASDVPMYGTSKNPGHPKACQKCGQTCGLVWPDEGFVLDQDWGDRSAGFENGFDLMLSKAMFDKIDWQALQPVEITPIPVVAREDVPARVQDALWGEIRVPATVVSVDGGGAQAETRQRADLPRDSGGSFVRMTYSDLDEDMGEPKVGLESDWKTAQLKRWCCEKCGRQKVKGAARGNIVVRRSEEMKSIPGVGEVPFVRIAGTRMLLHHKDIAAAIASISRGAILTEAIDKDGVAVGYSAISGLRSLQLNIVGRQPRRCERCGLASTAKATGLLSIPLKSIDGATTLVDPDGYLCVREDVLEKFMKKIGAVLGDQMVFQVLQVDTKT